MSPIETERRVSLYEILLEGQPIDPVMATKVADIRVSDYMHLPDVCTFTVSFDTDATPPEIDSQPFELGKKLELRLGARAETTVKTVFTGEIVTLLPVFSSGGAELTVRAFDRSHRLHRTRHVRTFQNQTASDIVTSIVSEAGFRAQTESSGEPFEFMQQNNETDLDFINRLAQRIGFEFFVEDADTARFQPIGQAEPVELEWPSALQSFTPRLTAVQQVEEVSVRSFDPLTKEVFEATAKQPRQSAQIGITRNTARDAFSGDATHVATEPAQTQGEAQQLAQSMLDRLANAYVTADGGGDGNPLIRAGCTVKVAGIGAKFGGTYRVLGTTHTFSGGSTYRTEFQSTAIQTISGAVAASRPADFAGQIVIGLVTNNQDPKGLGRVRVKYPVLGDDHEGWWARVAVPSAGNKRGMMMLPVVGEEVLVAFEHDDTTRPYIIGSLFNGKDKPTEELAAEDGSYGLLSDENIVMRAKKDLKISSEGELTFEITGDAKFTFSGAVDEKITKDRTSQASNWKAGGDINVELTAGAKFSISGAQISISSDGPLQISGNPVEIKSSSAVNISGPMINLG